ncbi:MAG: hypothetical protein K2W95_02825 [Candidatus Obscuribacterales bacterium]|nr:hypothetical protein [Candidatus Obscuribacterales bacterium]
MKIRILVSISLLMVVCLQAAQADPPPPTVQKPRPAATKGQVALERPPDLPYLPPFPQADYTMVNSRPNDRGGPGYEMIFFTPTSPPEVLNWYKGAFARNSWMIEGAPSEKYIAANRKNMCASVNVVPSWKKNYRSQVILGFKIFSKDEPEEPPKK